MKRCVDILVPARVRCRCALAFVLCLAVLAASACTRGARELAPDRTVGYPRGPWWRGDINHVVLGVEHVLIAYRGAELRDEQLQVRTSLPERSRTAALELAQKVADLGRAQPRQFVKLAQKYSDDRLTARLGGALGPVFVRGLPTAFIDALGNLRPGETSRVIETALGFHVLKRVAVGSPQQFCARHVSIGYKDTGLVKRDGRAAERTRAAALRLAEDVRAQALRGVPLSTLVDRYSDAFDAVDGGDYGCWYSEDSWGKPQILNLLAKLPEHGISQVVETEHGFDVFERAPWEQRPTHGAAALIVGYQSPDSFWDPTVTRSRAEALGLASEIASVLRRDPAQFATLARRYCDYKQCQVSGPGRFIAGKSGFAGLTRSLEHAAPDDLVGPFEGNTGFIVALKAAELAEQTEVREVVTYELPQPGPITLASASVEEIVEYTSRLKQAGRRELELSSVEGEQLDSIFDQMMLAFREVSPAERGRVAETSNAELALLLGPRRALKLSEIHRDLLEEVNGTLAR